MKHIIKKSEWTHLQQKRMLYQKTIDPQTKQGNPRLLADINHYCHLLLRRHRLADGKHVVNTMTGVIELRKEPPTPNS